MNNWINDSTIRDTALKAIMSMPSILLEKPSKTFKTKDHLLALKRRITDWFNGDILSLLHKRGAIQRGVKNSNKRQDLSKISKKFAEPMRKESKNSAIKLLTKSYGKWNITLELLDFQTFKTKNIQDQLIYLKMTCSLAKAKLPLIK